MRSKTLDEYYNRAGGKAAKADAAKAAKAAAPAADADADADDDDDADDKALDNLPPPPGTEPGAGAAKSAKLVDI